ncbi:hypothetical protein BZA77DRAFT_282650 [Pyronema omphalodes]|nr:hypothetical protein BZA77DRAFT_282650 [Pyronema omphalodes]
MPIIQELSDSEDESTTTSSSSIIDLKTASSILHSAIATLSSDTTALETRYNTILSNIPPVIAFLRTQPSSITSLQPDLISLLRPHPQLQPRLNYGFDDSSYDASPALPHYHALSTQLLNLLSSCSSFIDSTDKELIAALSGFHSLEDPWTTSNSQTLSRSIFSTISSNDLSKSYPPILSEIIKPLFSRTPSTNRITPAGRLAIRENTNNRIDTSPPLWLTKRPEVLAILEVILQSIPAAEIEGNWGLIIPPVLTLMDNTITSVKTRAVGMISTLLQRLEEDDGTKTLLKRTGLAPVFWDAVLATLSYLPPLTPVSEAVPLLKAAYRCLIQLSKAREKELKKRALLLDTVVRDGILRGFRFADKFVDIVKVLVESLADVIEEMGVYFVKHLKSIVPILADLLADPFGDANLLLLQVLVETIQVLVRNCWVRLESYTGEILRGTTVCWGRLQDGDRNGEEVERVRNGLRKLVGMVKATVGEEEWREIEGGIRGVDEGVFGGLF